MAGKRAKRRINAHGQRRGTPSETGTTSTSDDSPATINDLVHVQAGGDVFDHWLQDAYQVRKEDLRNPDRVRGYYERGRLLNEIHDRAGFPLLGYARVTHMTRVFRSAEDDFRAAVRAELEQEFEEFVRQAKAKGISFPDDAKHETSPPGDVIPHLIRAIAPTYYRERSRGRVRPSGTGFAPPRAHKIGWNLEELRNFPGGLRSKGRRRLIRNHHRDTLKATVARLPDYINKTTDAWGGAELLSGAEASMGVLKRSLRPAGSSPQDGAFHEMVSEFDKQHGTTELSRIELEGGQISGNHACWLRLPDRPLGAKDDDRNVFRMNWQLYSLSQDFTFYEDFNNPALAKLSDQKNDAELLKYWTDEKYPLVNTSWTALDTFESRLEAKNLLKERAFGLSGAEAEAARCEGVSESDHGEDTVTGTSSDETDDGEKFRWRGRLYLVAHYWVLPGEHFVDTFLTKQLTRHTGGLFTKDDYARDVLSGVTKFLQSEWPVLLSTKGLAGARPDQFEKGRAIIFALENFARAHFDRQDRSRREASRNDFVISLVAGGRAILVADARPFSRPPLAVDDDDRLATGEDASRTILIDFGLNDEQRGRTIKRCTDIATFRQLGLRDVHYFDAIYDALNGLSVEINELYAKAEKAQRSKHPDAWTEVAEVMSGIGSDLAKLNYFVTYGISGKALSTADYRNSLETCCEDLRELRVPGFPTVAEYMKRFELASEKIQRVSDRYNALRRRLGEIAAVANADLSRQQLVKLNSAATQHTYVMIIAAAAAIFSAIAAFRSASVSGAVERLDASAATLSESAERLREALQDEGVTSGTALPDAATASTVGDAATAPPEAEP